MPMISILIVNYNTKDLVCACVASLLQQKEIVFEIILVDNASHDGSVKALREKFGEKIRLIASQENLGFGRGNNLAASFAQGEIFYLLNPDARLKNEYDLSHLYHFMQAHPEYGVVGTAIHEPRRQRWIEPNEKYPSEQHLKYTQKLKNLPGKIAWVLGASMAIPREVYQRVQGFDPKFFLYGEETDLCLRIREAGFAIGICKEVKVEHVGGASEWQSSSKETWLRKQKGLYLFCHKHYDPRDVKHIATLSIQRTRRKLFLLKLQRFLGKEIKAKMLRLEATLEVARQQL